MKRLAFILAGTAFAATAVLGCRPTRVTYEHYERPRTVVHERVYVPDTHVCSYDGCDNHYWNGHQIVEIVGHHHGPNCGHGWDGTHWVISEVDPAYRVDRSRRHDRHQRVAPPVHVEPIHRRSRVTPPVRVERHRRGSRPAIVKRTTGHTHSATCGCVYDGRHSRWIKIKAQGHRHGPNCGHVFINGRWTIRR